MVAGYVEGSGKAFLKNEKASYMKYKSGVSGGNRGDSME